VSRRLREPNSSLAQGLFNDKLPEYMDLLVPEEPRTQVEAEFIGALRHLLNEHLGERGWVDYAGPSAGNVGYRFHVVTSRRESLWVGLSFDEMIAMGEGQGITEKGMFDRIGGKLVEQLKQKMGESTGGAAVGN
jgi:hypothetical protein